MLIAITANSNDPDSEVDTRFGRAQYFHIVDTETDELKVIDNKQNLDMLQGAGIQTAQLLANHKVETILTGHCGPKAFQTLQAARIKVITGVEGKVKDAVNKFKEGQYKKSNSPDVQSHWE
ncbi:MAG: NifB/NifX family molybdenum-iron cluster-binding protein [candidate division Zixibacteria bacterium]|nr:NifB/NifX family molybdenum-iron cluster-binding protein [candidate division Zixibacteria bacterium]